MLILLSMIAVELFLMVIFLFMKDKGKLIIAANLICVAIIVSLGIYCHNSSSDYVMEKKELEKIERRMKEVEKKQTNIAATLSANMATGSDLDKFGEMNQQYNEFDEELHRLIREYNKKVERCNELLNKDRKRNLLLRSCVFEKEIQPLAEHNHAEHEHSHAEHGHNH